VVPPVIAELDAVARRHETPCGPGHVVWREWGSGTPLVLLHGGHGSWRHWIRNVAFLAQHFRVLVPDMPGYGESASLPGTPTAEKLGASLSDGLDEIAKDAAERLIVGFSFGGVIGGHLAVLQRARLARLVVVGPGGLGLRRPPIEPLLGWRRLATEAERDAAHRRNLEILMIHDKARIDPLALYVQRENTSHARVLSRPISATDTLRRRLYEIEAPIAGIWGEFDATVGPFMDERAKLLRSIDPGSEFVVIPGAGHWVQYEAAEAFNPALLEILTARRHRIPISNASRE
jgi:pimeloyl-ACP methyl ester carboxylesterase